MKTFFCIAAMLWWSCAMAQPAAEPYPYELSYFFPKGDYQFNPAIPQPKEILGYELGQQHVDWNDVLAYMQALATHSKRVSLRKFGRSYEYRPFIQLVITSEKNQQNLEKIREQHLLLDDKKTTRDTLPLVVNLLYSIHGNEASGVNSSLALAYFFAALEGSEAEALLDNTVLLLVPGQNPDGINRFASWVNATRSFPDVADRSSREFFEPYPSSRLNHYMADCNRDWLAAEHPEGQSALDMYHAWMPNVVCDFHEMANERTYYFSPGHPRRVHELISRENQTLSAKLTAFCADALDQNGSLYFSKERYDDFYLGKGAAYGDLHGAVCLLFEQMNTYGHLRQSLLHGEISFPFAIRNQTLSAIAMVRGAQSMKAELQSYRRQHRAQAHEQAQLHPVQAYVFNARGSEAIAFHFLKTLQRHRIEVYHLAKTKAVNGDTYAAENSYVIPLRQRNFATIRALMESATKFDDSTFYDISTWTFPHAYNLQYAALGSAEGLLGERVDSAAFPQGNLVGSANPVAYLFENTQYYTPKMLMELLKRGLRVRVGAVPFTTAAGDIAPRKFGYGTLLVQVQNQALNAADLRRLMERMAVECGVDVYAAATSQMQDYDLGSPFFMSLRLPKIALITGPEMGAAESGEVWCLLNQRFQMTPTLVDASRFVSPDSYNVIVMANGAPEFSKLAEENLMRWLRAGGVLIATGKAALWASKAGLAELKALPASNLAAQPSPYKPYAERLEAHAGSSISGVILGCRLDETHPLGWGYGQQKIAVFRSGQLAFEPPKNPYSAPLSYLNEPYLSGCISPQNLAYLAQTPAAIVLPCEKGKVILFADDMNFRMYWYGTTKLFMNAILFGNLIANN
jgi:hypothetical protein